MDRHTKRKPIIGVTGPAKGGNTLWWFTKIAVYLAGGRAKRITPKDIFMPDLYDGFIISGGRDISPGTYGETSRVYNYDYDTDRDALEQTIVRYAVKYRVPLLGICRGMQLINITLGGSLYQEASNVLEDFLPNTSLISKVIGRRTVRVKLSSRLYRILGCYPYYDVNSIHHQAIKHTGKNLFISAREANGLVQAIEAKSEFKHPYLIGVQWHPELMLHAKSSRNLFEELIGYSRKTA